MNYRQFAGLSLTAIKGKSCPDNSGKEHKLHDAQIPVFSSTDPRLLQLFYIYIYIYLPVLLVAQEHKGKIEAQPAFIAMNYTGCAHWIVSILFTHLDRVPFCGASRSTCGDVRNISQPNRLRKITAKMI